VKCIAFVSETFTWYGSNKTCGRKFLHCLLWNSLAKLCTKNYENRSIFVKVTAKKSLAPFYVDTMYNKL